MREKQNPKRKKKKLRYNAYEMNEFRLEGADEIF